MIPKYNIDKPLDCENNQLDKQNSLLSPPPSNKQKLSLSSNNTSVQTPLPEMMTPVNNN